MMRDAMDKECLSLSSSKIKPDFHWRGVADASMQSEAELKRLLNELNQALYVLLVDNKLVISDKGALSGSGDKKDSLPCLGMIPSIRPEQLGDASFCRDYGTKFSYYAGAMANGISSEEMVIALGKNKILGSFGGGGLSVENVEKAILNIKNALPEGPYAINLLHNPGHPDWEEQCVELFLKYNVNVVEASAYLNLTPAIVRYRVAGLEKDATGRIHCKNRVIAKISRPEVARRFMEPAPDKILKKLLKNGLITQEQMTLAQQVPIADDVTVESNSGGHTDGGTLSCILPSMIKLRNEIQEKFSYQSRIRVGAAGGMGTPEAVLSAYSMGAAYVVTGSINQSCVEAGTSAGVKKLLAEAEVADVAMTPSADMFEIGAKVQVLKRNTMYSVRAQKLYNLYKQYDSVEDIPEKELSAIEKQYFKRPIAQVWQETVEFLSARAPDQVKAGQNNAKKKMALIFQWYLGQSSTWAVQGEADRMIDYQVWCGPAMGACNEWLANSQYAQPAQRSVVSLSEQLMYGAAYLSRVQDLKLLGVKVSSAIEHYFPGSIEHLSPKAETNDQKINAQKTERSKGESKDMEYKSKLDLKESKEYYKKMWDVLPGGVHYNFADPERALVIPFNKGRKSRVWDLDGNEHIDLFCKFGALFVGHHNEEYNEALMKYMHKVTSVDICDLEYDVCSLLKKHIPCAEMSRFCLSGTEAVQNAIRLARGYTGKNRFIRFHGHYHGNADNVMGARKRQDLSFPTPEKFNGDMLDTLGRATNILEDQSFMLPWNDIEALEQTINNYKDELAAVLMEPICINGGGILPKAGYLERAKELCEQNNILLIFDEVITGIRLGLGGAQSILGVTPHLATFGKALGGGSMPISAIAGKKEIMDLYTQGKVIHAGTFNGYPLGLAAIKATIELIENDPGCYDRMGGFMAQISNAFIKAATANDMPLVIQGMPTALVYHSQAELVERSEGYSDKVKFCDIIIREVAKRHGIQFSPLSRVYSNLQMNQDDVGFFEERISDVMHSSKKIIDITFKEGEVA